ncbi:hypothetical protein LWU32_23055 [Enterobacter hormaechei]|nr:hypothetical protein [Enterobacter hormaechei]
MISPSRLGVTPYNNLAWGSRSVLNKLSEEKFDVTSVLTQLSRQTRNAFAANPVEGLDKVLEDVKLIGNKLGVPLGVKWFTEFGHLNRGDMLTSEQHRCHNEKKKFQRRV